MRHSAGVQEPRRVGSVGVVAHAQANVATASQFVGMCYVATSPNRPKWKSETTPTPDEALNAITGLAAYCATVDIRLDEGFIVHPVQVDRTLNRVGRF